MRAPPKTEGAPAAADTNGEGGISAPPLAGVPVEDDAVDAKLPNALVDFPNAPNGDCVAFANAAKPDALNAEDEV